MVQKPRNIDKIYIGKKREIWRKIGINMDIIYQTSPNHKSIENRSHLELKFYEGMGKTSQPNVWMDFLLFPPAE
jgi:hypothetical protein